MNPSVAPTTPTEPTDGVAISNAQDNISYMNTSLLNMFGLADLSEIKGWHWRTLYSPKSCAVIESQAIPALQTGKAWSGVVEAKIKSGTTRTYALKVANLPFGGLIWTTRDKGEDVASPPDRRRQSELREDYLSALKHDLRTPLAALGGCHFLLRKKLESQTDAQANRYLDLMGESIASLGAKIDQILIPEGLTSYPESHAARAAAAPSSQTPATPT